MKNKVLNILLVFGISIINNMYSSVGVFLENHYGATLNYKSNPSIPEGQRIGNNVRLFIGELNSIPELAIRTTGRGSQWISYYYDLMPFLNKIKPYESKYQNHDIVIIVDPTQSYLSTSWNITYRWEPKRDMQPFEFETYTQTLEERLEDIRNGSLGEDYAQKATAICAANYERAKALGKIDLCNELKRNLDAPVYKVDPRAIQKKGFISPDLTPSLEDIKNSINRLYNALQRYKERGEAQ